MFRNPILLLTVTLAPLSSLCAQETVAPIQAQPVLEPAGVALEEAPTFVASEILPPDWLAGPHHRVRDYCPSDGYLIHFTTDSDFGTYESAGRRELQRHLNEIQAIAKLVSVSKSDLFAEGLQRSVEAPVEAVRNIAHDPSGTVRQLPDTVGHFFKRAGSAVASTARSIDRDVSGENSGRSGDAAGASAARSLKGLAGFDKAKLECARQLGVDPYSTNPRLQQEIEKVSWAFFAGGLPLRVGAAAASSGASAALTATKVVGLPEDIYALTPSELALRDREALTAGGVATETIDQILAHPVLAASLRHSMIRSLSSLPAGEGRLKLVALMAGVQTDRQAHFLQGVLELLAKRHATGSPYVTVDARGRVPVGITADGTLEVCAPVDFVSWNAFVGEFATAETWANDPSRRLVLGLGSQLSPQATAGFAAAGWEAVAGE